MRFAVVVVVCAAGCSSSKEPVAADVTGNGIVAEVHVHQYGDGSHVSAGFSTRAVTYHPELDEQLVQYAELPVASEGACTLYAIHVCRPTCDGTHQWCSATNVCTEYEPLQFLDRGPVVVTGSTLAPKITLTFDAQANFYRSDHSVNLPIFAAGDVLTIHSSEFDVTTTAPDAPDLVEPSGSFSLGALDSFHAAWKGHGGDVTVQLSANTKAGESAWITCSGPDAGSVVIPKSLIAQLPSAPRDLRLDVARYARVIVDVATPGQQAAVYVGSTRFVTGFD